MHIVETLVDVGESPVMRDILVDLDLARKVICGKSAMSGPKTSHDETYLRRGPAAPSGPSRHRKRCRARYAQ